MKAIQIRYLGYTETLPSRLKAFTDAGNLVETIDPNISELEEQVLGLARRYITKMGWSARISGTGVLKNGDWVFTLAPLRV